MKHFLISAIAILTLSFAACSNSQAPASGNSDTPSVKTAAIRYTCPMHPEVLSDKPGKCPVCKMNLVQKEDHTAAPDSTHTGH